MTIVRTLRDCVADTSLIDAYMNKQITRVYRGKEHAEVEFTVSS